MKKVLVAWIESQSTLIFLMQSLIQSKALTFFKSMKSSQGKKAVEEKFEVSRGWFMRFKKRNCFHNMRVQVEVASADIEAAANYSEDLANIKKWRWLL